MQDSIKWDGQDHAITNPTGPPSVTVAAKMVDDRTVEYIVKTDGKVTTTGRAVLSKGRKDYHQHGNRCGRERRKRS